MDDGGDPPPPKQEDKLSMSDPLSLLSTPTLSPDDQKEGILFASSGEVLSADLAKKKLFYENPFWRAESSTPIINQEPQLQPTTRTTTTTKTKPAPLLRTKSAWMRTAKAPRPLEKKRSQSPTELIGGRGVTSKSARVDKERGSLEDGEREGEVGGEGEGEGERKEGEKEGGSAGWKAEWKKTGEEGGGFIGGRGMKKGEGWVAKSLSPNLQRERWKGKGEEGEEGNEGERKKRGEGALNIPRPLEEEEEAREEARERKGEEGGEEGGDREVEKKGEEEDGEKGGEEEDGEREGGQEGDEGKEEEKIEEREKEGQPNAVPSAQEWCSSEMFGEEKKRKATLEKSSQEGTWPKELFSKRPNASRRERMKPELKSIALGLAERPQVSFRTAAIKPACFSVWDMDDFVEFNCGPENRDAHQFTSPPHILSRANKFQLDRRRTELEIKRDDGRKRGSLYQLSRYVETPIISDVYSPSLFAPVEGYMMESYFDLSSDSLAALLIDQERYTPYYRHCFYRKEHTNFMAFSENGPMFISAEKTSFDFKLPTVPCRVFLRACLPWSSETEADIWVVVNPTEKDNFKQVLERDLTFFLNTNVDRVVELQESSQDLFLKLENSLMVKNYKLGVLSWNCRQKTEDEIFANTVISPDFREFLDFLGEVVTLEGWPYYRAGLDVKANTTGEQSLFTRYLDYEVMFHVGAFLPHGEGEQQLGKKRHIGNDIVVIVFKESDGEEVLFDPSIFVSDFNHIFVVVQKMSNDALKDLYEKKALSSFDPSQTHYRVGFSSKQGVHSYEPPLPFPGIFEKNDTFRHFLLTKVLNSERSALYAQKFVTKMAKTRRAVFLDVAEDCAKLIKKKEKQAGGSKNKNLAWVKKGLGT